MEKIGDYRIDKLIATGGMAQIYRGTITSVGDVERVMALKVLHDHCASDQALVDSLFDEAKLLSAMNHKNICHTFGLEKSNHLHYIVMEYVEGADLSRILQGLKDNGKIFPIEAAIYITMEICAGLSYAHRLSDKDGNHLNLIHRDVNPQNILLSKEGEVKIIDFGIAKTNSPTNETQAGVIKGKFNYMSPEQARGDRIDQRTDVFATGAILYEMLCGQMLYPLDLSIDELRRTSRMADFTPISHLRSDIPIALQKILNKALARDVQTRFQTAREMQLALSNFFHQNCDIFDDYSLSEFIKPYLNPQKKPNPVEPFDEFASTNVFNKKDIAKAFKRSSTPHIARDLSLPDDNGATATIMMSLEEAEHQARNTGFFLASIFIGLLLIIGIAGVFLIATGKINIPWLALKADVTLTSIPTDAEIWIEDQNTNQKTPQTIYPSSIVTLKKEFYEDTIVNWHLEKDGIVQQIMLPKLELVSINSIPPKAKVYINGKYIGRTPVREQLAMIDEYTVELNLKDHVSEERIIRWNSEKDGALNLNVKLKKTRHKSKHHK